MEFEKAYWIASLLVWEIILSLLTAWPFCFVFLLRNITPLSCCIVAIMTVLIILNICFFDWDFEQLGEQSENRFQQYIKMHGYLCPFSMVIGLVEYILRLTRSKTAKGSNQANYLPGDIPVVGNRNLNPEIKRAWSRFLLIVPCIFAIRVMPGIIHSQQIYALEQDLIKLLKESPNNLIKIKEILYKNGVYYHQDPDGIFWARVPTKNPFIPFEQELFLHIKTNGDLITSFKINYSSTAP